VKKRAELRNNGGVCFVSRNKAKQNELDGSSVNEKVYPCVCVSQKRLKKRSNKKKKRGDVQESRNEEMSLSLRSS
jgi:hypothetical protein